MMTTTLTETPKRPGLAEPLSHQEAHRLYWETDTPTAAIQKQYGLKHGQVAKLAGPIDIGVRCPGCGTAVLATSRSNRDRMLSAVDPPKWRSNERGWQRRLDYSLMCGRCYRVESERLRDLNRHVEEHVVVNIMAGTLMAFLCEEEGEQAKAWLKDPENNQLVLDVTVGVLEALEKADVQVRLAYYIECADTSELIDEAFARYSAPEAPPES